MKRLVPALCILHCALCILPAFSRERATMNNRATFSSIVFFFASLASLAFEVGELRQMEGASGKEYIGIRDRIVSEGQEALPGLLSIANNADADWRLRLAAGTCAERILYRSEIDELDHHDWSSDPEFSDVWHNGAVNANGWHRDFTPMFLAIIGKKGFWFHYLEFFDERLDVFGLDTSFRFIPSYVCENATGGIRILAALIADERVRSAYAQDLSPSPADVRVLETFVEDGTFPQGARAFLQGSRPGFSPAPHKWKKWLPLVDDIAFLKDTQSRFGTNALEYRLIARRLSAIESDTSTNVLAPPAIDIQSFLPALSQSGIDATMSRESELERDSDEDHRSKWTRRRASFFILTIGVGILLIMVWFNRARHDQRRRSFPR